PNLEREDRARRRLRDAAQSLGELEPLEIRLVRLLALRDVLERANDADGASVGEIGLANVPYPTHAAVVAGKRAVLDVAVTAVQRGETAPSGLLDARPILGMHARNEVRDRKSTRLNSSHVKISYAVFCLKKK